MDTNDITYFTDGIGREESEHEERGDACRTLSCHSRIHVHDVITERGSVTLCRYCRNQFFEVSS